MSFRVTVI